jgi:hypothetical protein
MEGGPDPDCRRTYPTAPDEAALAHRAFVRAAIHARRDRRALRRGSARVVAGAASAVAIAREADGECALVAMNAAREPVRLDVDARHLAGLRPVELPVVAAGRVEAGSIVLPPQGALVLA